MKDWSDRSRDSHLDAALIIQLYAVLERRQEQEPTTERAKFLQELRPVRNQLAHAGHAVPSEKARDDVLTFLRRIEATTLGTSAAQNARLQASPDLIAAALARAAELANDPNPDVAHEDAAASQEMPTTHTSREVEQSDRPATLGGKVHQLHRRSKRAKRQVLDAPIPRVVGYGMLALEAPIPRVVGYAMLALAPAYEPVPSDAELITVARGGSARAYAELYNRHRAAAYNLARQLARSPAEADDLVSESFARLLDTLRGGGGPDSAFRAYLLTALRHCAYDRTRRDRRVELSDDVASFDPGVPFVDTAVAGLDRSLAAQAFARLPERWQTVLWHTEIEGQAPAEIAPLLGLSPNGVSALAYRAREGLRQEYLQVHLAEREQAGLSGRELERCRAASERLGAWTRGGLSRREMVQVELHLDECARCRALAVELADINEGLR